MTRPDSFPSTSWTLLSQARRTGTPGQDALERFTNLYYGPVTAYLRGLLRGTEHEALDHANEFFASKIFLGRVLVLAERGHSRFRHYLKRCVHNYAISVVRGTRRTVPIEDLEPVLEAGGAEADHGFHVEWVRGLVGRAVDATGRLCKERGQEMHFELFRRRFLSDPDRYPRWSEVGAGVPIEDGSTRDLSEREAQRYAETAVRHFRKAVMEELQSETGSRDSAQEELATLFALFEESR